MKAGALTPATPVALRDHRELADARSMKAGALTPATPQRESRAWSAFSIAQ